MTPSNAPTPPHTSKSWSWMLPLVAFAALLHLAVLDRETRHGREGEGHNAIRNVDERSYFLYCANGVAERGWAFLADEESLRSPPVPWAWLLLWGRNVALTRYANIALVILGSLLIASVVHDRFGRRMGLLAFVLCAGGFQVVLYSGTVMSEPPAFFFTTLCLWAVSRAATDGKMRHVALAGLACALAALSRPSLQFFPFVLAAAWWLADRRRGHKEQDRSGPPISGKAVAVLLACYVALVAPWIIKNKVAFGVARIANGFGAVMYLGSDLRTEGDAPPFSGMDWWTGAIPRPYNHMHIEGDKRLMAAAIGNIRQHPVAWARLGVRKVGRILIGGPNWHFFPADHYKAKARLEGWGPTAVVFAWQTVAGTVVTLFGLAGLLLMPPKHHAIAAAGLALVAYLVALHALSYAIPRFGMPFYPALVIGFCAYFSHGRRRLLTILLAIACVTIPVYLAMRYQYRPRHVVSANKLDHFTIARTWTVPDDGPMPIIIDAAGCKTPFNACMFVRATTDESLIDGPVFAVVYLRPDGAKAFDESTGIQFPLITDGRPHTYQLCLELQAAWRGRGWNALKLEVLPHAAAVLRDVELTLAN